MRHALDFSAPRLSDLPRDELNQALMARHEGRLEAYRRQMAASHARNALPLHTRILRGIGFGS